MVFTKEDLQDPCAYAFCVKRDCNICESLIVERAPNPYSSLTQQFILSHLAHMEYGLNQILEEAHEVSAKDFAIISMIENAFIVAKLFNPEIIYKQNQSSTSIISSPKQFSSTFNKGLQTVDNAVSFHKKLLSKMTHQKIVRDDPQKKTFSNRKKLSSTKEKSKYIGSNTLVENNQSAGCIGYQNVCKSVYPKYTPNKNNIASISLPTTLSDNPVQKIEIDVVQQITNEVPESIITEPEQNRELKVNNKKQNSEILPSNIINNNNNNNNPMTSRNDVSVNLLSPSLKQSTSKNILLCSTPESTYKDKNKTNLSKNPPPNLTLTLLDTTPPLPPPVTTTTPTVDNTIEERGGGGGGVGGHTSGWRSRMNKMLQSSPETMNPPDVTPSSSSLYMDSLPRQLFQNDISPPVTITGKSLYETTNSSPVITAVDSLSIDHHHHLYSDSLELKNAFSNNTRNAIQTTVTSTTTVTSSSPTKSRPSYLRPIYHDTNNSTLKNTISSYTTTTTTSSNVSWTNASQDSNGHGHHSRSEELSKDSSGGDQVIGGIDSIDKGDDISSNDTFSLGEYPYHYQYQHQQDSNLSCTDTRTTSSTVEKNKLERKGALAKLRRCIRGVIRSNARTANNINYNNDDDHTITVSHDL